MTFVAFHSASVFYWKQESFDSTIHTATESARVRRSCSKIESVFYRNLNAIYLLIDMKRQETKCAEFWSWRGP